MSLDDRLTKYSNILTDETDILEPNSNFDFNTTQVMKEETELILNKQRNLFNILTVVTIVTVIISVTI